jgi:hypothetical protein
MTSDANVRKGCHVLQLAFLVDKYDIPPELVLNSDQTGVPFVPAPQYQWAPKGSKDVSVNGFGEKRQITATPTTTASGDSLPLQVKILHMLWAGLESKVFHDLCHGHHNT